MNKRRGVPGHTDGAGNMRAKFYRRLAAWLMNVSRRADLLADAHAGMEDGAAIAAMDARLRSAREKYISEIEEIGRP